MRKDELISAAKTLKIDAKGLRNQEIFGLALEILDLAVGKLKTALERGGDQKTTWAELADCFGIKGGIYSRQKDFLQAFEMYREGRMWEEKLPGKTSTYNLSNVIVHSIIVGEESIESEEIQETLERLISPLLDQVQGPRKDDWWAWADLGQFYLLQGEAAEALAKYEEGFGTGPTHDDLESSLRVLRVLKDSVHGTRFREGFVRGVAKLEAEKQGKGQGSE